MIIEGIRKKAATFFSPKAAATDTKLSKEDMGIITQLAQEFKDRTRKDVQTWVTAKQSAETGDIPRWADMQDLYDYLKPDGHFGSQTGLRIAASRCTPYHIRDKRTKVQDDDKTLLIKEEWFFNMLGDLLESTFYKTTLLQFPNYKSGDMTYAKIPRRNIVPQLGIILKEVRGDIGFAINDPVWADTFVQMTHQSDFGIMDDIVRDLIWKKNSRESWAEFSEKFGIPLVSATTTTRDKKELARINAMLKALGQAATAVLPTGSTITIHDSAAKGDPFNTYLQSVKLSNEEISKRIVGGTMISDAGSSHSQGITHENAFAMISEEDKICLEFVINKQVLPKLKGYKETDEFTFDRTEKLSLTDQWTIVQGMITAGADVDPDMIKWIAERFNVPVKTFTKAQQTNTPPANFNQAAKVKAIALAATTGINWPNYIAACGHNHSLPTAAWQDIPELKKLGDEILKNLYNNKDTVKQQFLKAIEAGSKMRDGLHDGWGNRRISISYDATDNRALAAMEYNLFHFSATKEKAGVLALNEMLLNKDKLNITSFDEFKKAAAPFMKDMDVNKLKTEYNFAVATGQNASRYNQFLSEADEVTSFVQYQTVGDERVRSSHAALDGRIFNIRDTEARSLWPPNDWGCRCEFIQYLGDTKGKTTTGTEGQQLIKWSDKQKKDFGINRGDIGEVFTASQQYIQDKGIGASIDTMKYLDYGLQTLADAQKGKRLAKIDETINGTNVKELFKPIKGQKYMGQQDYLQRNITLSEKDFNEHTSGKYLKANERRHQLFPHINDILNNPDEVYFNQYSEKTFQTVYIKHFGNMSLAATTKLGKKGIELKTWFEVKADDFMRKGLLIHRGK